MISNLIRKIGVGAIGALTLRALRRSAHEQLHLGDVRDRAGERVIKKTTRILLGRPLRGRQLRRAARLRDLVANTIFFTLLFGARRPRRPLLRGLIGGSAAGIGTAIARRLIAGKKAGAPGLTAGLYLAGGLAAASAWRGLNARSFA